MGGKGHTLSSAHTSMHGVLPFYTRTQKFSLFFMPLLRALFRSYLVAWCSCCQQFIDGRFFFSIWVCHVCIYIRAGGKHKRDVISPFLREPKRSGKKRIKEKYD